MQVEYLHPASIWQRESVELRCNEAAIKSSVTAASAVSRSELDGYKYAPGKSNMPHSMTPHPGKSRHIGSKHAVIQEEGGLERQYSPHKP
jgi:hypothetical protein